LVFYFSSVGSTFATEQVHFLLRIGLAAIGIKSTTTSVWRNFIRIRCTGTPGSLGAPGLGNSFAFIFIAALQHQVYLSNFGSSFFF
jgi:hypothetical protein